MVFTIVFDEYGLTLNTTDMETAFHACDMPQLVQAVINAETGKILWGSLERPTKPDKTKVGCITRANEIATPDKIACWTYPHPIVTNATIDEVGFKAPFVLDAKVYNEETEHEESLYYELDETGFKNAMKDIETMVVNKWSNWTATKRILKARFFSNKNGQFYLKISFNLTF